jgi:putative transposase
MKFDFIDEESGGISVNRSCQLMAVSRSGYYKHKEKPISRRKLENERLTALIRERFFKAKEVEGSPRITEHLHDLGEVVSENRVARIMRKNGLKAHAGRKYKQTTDSNPVSYTHLTLPTTR